jgi:hypothetical protein
VTPARIGLAAAVLAGILIGSWWLLDRRAADGPAGDPGRPPGGAATAGNPAAALFTAQPIGEAARAEERPQIAHVAAVDLDRDGLVDVLVCDALRNLVSWIRQSPRGTFTEQRITGVAAPAHVEAVDFDRDGDLDLLVAALGFLYPNNNRVGSVIVLENDGQQRFRSHYIADRVARVADARAADFDGDGDLDVSVAGFGYDDGETSWLQNQGDWRFEQRILQRLSGAINAVPTDVNGDSFPDIVALISQEWEEIWAFVNDGRGAFTPRMLWGSTNPDFGSSWLTMVDMDRDGDRDVLYANGDAFEYAPPNSRPWPGGPPVRAATNCGPPGRSQPRRRRCRWRRRPRCARRHRQQRLGQSPGAQPAVAGERRPDALRDARRRQRTHPSPDPGDWRPGRRRQAGCRRGWNAHQPPVRSHRTNHRVASSRAGGGPLGTAASVGRV